METSIETDRKIMEINYFSGVILTKALMPSMIKEGFGRIVAVSSVTGKFGFPLRSAYAASKHAMYGFYETIEAEYYDKGINTTMVCPGRIRTNISMKSCRWIVRILWITDRNNWSLCFDMINGIRKNKRVYFPGWKGSANGLF